MKPPVKLTQEYYYDPATSTMHYEDEPLPTYQQPIRHQQYNSNPPINININLAEILAGLGLKDIIAKILSSKNENIHENKNYKIDKSKLLDAIKLGASPKDISNIMIQLKNKGCLK